MSDQSLMNLMQYDTPKKLILLAATIGEKNFVIEDPTSSPE